MAEDLLCGWAVYILAGGRKPFLFRDFHDAILLNGASPEIDVEAAQAGIRFFALTFFIQANAFVPPGTYEATDDATTVLRAELLFKVDVSEVRSRHNLTSGAMHRVDNVVTLYAESPNPV